LTKKNGCADMNQVDKKQRARDQVKRLASGIVQTIGVAGGITAATAGTGAIPVVAVGAVLALLAPLLKEIIFGMLEDENAREEEKKLNKALAEITKIGEKFEESDLDFANLLVGQCETYKLNRNILAEIKKLVRLIINPDTADISSSLEIALDKYFAKITLAEKYISFITESKIRENVISDRENLLNTALDYYKINDRDDFVFKVVCNDIDIPNDAVIKDAKNIINNLSPKSAFWITGDGGTGKTSLLMRLAVLYAKLSEKVFWINFENPSFNSSKISELLNYIKDKTQDQKAYIFIDNPNVNQEALGKLLLDIANCEFDFALIFTERTIRLELLKQDNVQYLIDNQEIIEPLKIYNSKEQRKSVYKKLYELIGGNNKDIWQIIEDVGINTDIAYVNATYEILYELSQKKYINYVFDWIEFENIAAKRFKSLKNAYRYIALFYLFGINTPLTMLEKLFDSQKPEVRTFIDSFNNKTKEPVVLFGRDTGIFKTEYFLRTKHEVVAELYFNEKKLNKNELMADVIREFDPHNYSEAQALIQLFGNKYNIKKNNLDYEKLLQYFFSESILKKIQENRILHHTLYLTKSWFFQSNNKLPEAEKILKELLELDKKNLQARTELAKIYQRQNKLPEAEKILKELLKLDKKNLQARTELAKIYQRQDKLPEAEKVLLECIAYSPKDLNSRTELAKIYQRQDKLPEAKKVLLECIAYNPKDLNSRTELAKLYQRQDKLPEAEKILKELLELDKKNLQARTELAKIYQRQNKLPEAEKVLLECIAYSPKDLNSRTELAKIYQRQNKLPEAEKYLQEYIALDPEGLHPRTELAKIYQRQNKLPEAEKILLESLEIDNKQLHPRTELAKIYQRQNKLPEAEKILLESLEIDKKNLFAISELISCYDRTGDTEKCFKELDKFLENINLRPGRTPQAMFNNIFKFCSKYNCPHKAIGYYNKYSNILDERNIELFRSRFPDRDN